ncbi:hypothetical protein ACIA8C_05765 [Nocardia sp. NPDC051321]|uniref:ATP dependent DNA ligase n=1 Tax=Nocardia sp. NPDC051321 TaxID=3364323 RepID=UPI0037A4AC12
MNCTRHTPVVIGHDHSVNDRLCTRCDQQEIGLRLRAWSAFTAVGQDTVASHHRRHRRWLDAGRWPTFGSLVLAGNDDTGRLRCIGCVGTGFTMAARRALRSALDQLTRTNSPLDAPAPAARTARWVDPVLIADIGHRELTVEGIVRHPSFRGIRTDHTVADVGWPQ